MPHHLRLWLDWLLPVDWMLVALGVLLLGALVVLVALLLARRSWRPLFPAARLSRAPRRAAVPARSDRRA